jgi:2-oxo-4-hydroxy-4-carboxy-5-ureidoimidazoline decarboxylase
MPTVIELDTLSEAQAAELLRSCCGSSRWVSAMVSRRPFGNRDAVLSTADALWRGLTPQDWQEAFRHHPRIGEQRSAAEQSERAQGWSAREQAGVQRADATTRQQLAEMNRGYEEQFGWTYIVNATGKSADQMLLLARQRMTNAPDVELRVAASEHEQIMLNRLVKLLVDDRQGGSVP